MANSAENMVLQEAAWPVKDSELWAKRIALVIGGVAFMMLCAKIMVPLPPSPVPVTLGTFAVLTIGAAWGPRLGLVTILGYLLVGAMGFDVFANSSAIKNGWTYMVGGTGGYLVGYVLATLALGYAATRGWDRKVWSMALVLLAANVLIYVPGLLWLRQFAESWAQTLEWGITPFLIGDAVKLTLAALLLPAAWKMVGNARG